MSSNNAAHQLNITYLNKECSKIDADIMDVGELFEVRDYRKLASPFPRVLIDLAHNHHPMSSTNGKRHLKITCHIKKCSKIDADAVGVSDLFEIRKFRECSKIDADTIDVGELFEVREFRRLPSLFPEDLIALAHCHHPVRSVNETHHLKITCHIKQ